MLERTPGIAPASLLRGALVALAIAAAPVAAQAPGDVRIALVIGNSAYAGPAALPNPVNDAKAMGDTLRGLGFDVVQLHDGTRAQMAEAVQKVREALRGKQGIGMLYYAGHGLQLDWRNYMVPVDAKLKAAADVPPQTVEVGAVIEAFKTAGNRMNILVLDACRDNPFSDASTAKGLAQLDAPPGTILAYATAPGNVAEDGRGSNGLYTQFLLQELVKPQSKIEDVFKRTRFEVRRASKGRQIPWESTSLEEDFMFNAGKVVVAPKPDNRAREQAFEREKAAWDAIRNSNNPADVYAFLLEHPSGATSELAQARLNQLQQREVLPTAAQGQPAPSEGLVRYRVGDSYTFSFKDRLTGLETRRPQWRVTGIQGDVVQLNGGELVMSLSGADVRTERGVVFDPPLLTLPGNDYQIGKKWTVRANATSPRGSFKIEMTTRIVAYEEVTVPAGTFKAYRLESELFAGETSIRMTRWNQPEWGQSIKVIEEVRGRGGNTGEIRELVARVKGPG
jgi:hypothetical protein